MELTRKIESLPEWNDCLFFVFLHLKLSEEITWSWWWVSAPIWVGFILKLISAFASKKKEETKPKPKWEERFAQMQEEHRKRKEGSA